MLMKRLPAKLLIFLILLLFSPPLMAQDFGFNPVNLNLSGIGNQGVIGSSSRTHFLNSSINESQSQQINQLSTFNVVDIATGNFNSDSNLDIVVVAADDTNRDGV